MSERPRQLYDVDDKELARQLETLAAAIRNRGVWVRGVGSEEHVDVKQDDVERTVSVSFLFGEQYDDLLRIPFQDGDVDE